MGTVLRAYHRMLPKATGKTAFFTVFYFFRLPAGLREAAPRTAAARLHSKERSRFQTAVS